MCGIVGYVGSRGLFLPFSSVDLNQLDLSTIAKYGASLCVYNNPACVNVPNQWNPILPGTNQWAGSSTVPLYVSLEKYPQFQAAQLKRTPDITLSITRFIGQF